MQTPTILIHLSLLYYCIYITTDSEYGVGMALVDPKTDSIAFRSKTAPITFKGLQIKIEDIDEFIESLKANKPDFSTLKSVIFNYKLDTSVIKDFDFGNIPLEFGFLQTIVFNHSDSSLQIDDYTPLTCSKDTSIQPNNKRSFTCKPHIITSMDKAQDFFFNFTLYVVLNKKSIIIKRKEDSVRLSGEFVRYFSITNPNEGFEEKHADDLKKINDKMNDLIKEKKEKESSSSESSSETEETEDTTNETETETETQTQSGTISNSKLSDNKTTKVDILLMCLFCVSILLAIVTITFLLFRNSKVVGKLVGSNK
eukprot:GAHX01001956.1.p1 GENE.GAHX01001956.1~~GAHX01001956.1.p1  ORF type:complete len:312 (-),score=59.90 GAHX01001956.1:28-963(-)